MAAIKGASGVVMQTDDYLDSGRFGLVGRAAGHSVTGITGTMAAALGANSSVFVARLDPSAGAGFKAYITQLRLQYTTIIAYTTPLTASRRLALFRGSAAAASAGTALVPVKKNSGDATVSQFTAAEGGSVQIATTAALTVTSIVFETDPIRTLSLLHVGAAGGYIEEVWGSDPVDGNPVIVLNPGELIALRNPAAMDAAGTWQLAVNMDWYEGVI